MRLLLPVFALLVLLTGCDAADDPIPTALLPDDARYAWSMESHLVEGDSLLFGANEDVRIRTASRNASVPGYRGLIEIEASVGVGSSRSWYESTEERLRDIAYASPGETPVVEPRGVIVLEDVFGLPYTVAQLVAQHRAARGASEDDSITVRADPRVVYELPLTVGEAWVSFTDPFESTREVVGREMVTVEAGTFDCFVIRTEIGIATGAFEWLDYVSAERGLVLRTTESVQEYRGPDNQPNGQLLRTIERLEMTSGR